MSKEQNVSTSRISIPYKFHCNTNLLTQIKDTYRISLCDEPIAISHGCECILGWLSLQQFKVLFSADVVSDSVRSNQAKIRATLCEVISTTSCQVSLVLATVSLIVVVSWSTPSAPKYQLARASI